MTGVPTPRRAAQRQKSKRLVDRLDKAEVDALTYAFWAVHDIRFVLIRKKYNPAARPVSAESLLPNAAYVQNSSTQRDLTRMAASGPTGLPVVAEVIATPLVIPADGPEGDTPLQIFPSSRQRSPTTDQSAVGVSSAANCLSSRAPRTGLTCLIHPIFPCSDCSCLRDSRIFSLRASFRMNRSLSL